MTRLNGKESYKECGLFLLYFNRMEFSSLVLIKANFCKWGGYRHRYIDIDIDIDIDININTEIDIEYRYR